MERRKESTKQPRRNSERQRGNPYQQLAADGAQPLAELEVPRANERTTHEEARESNDGKAENGMDIRQQPREQTQERNKKQRKNPYQQLAADIAQPLAELQVPGASNFDREAETIVDGGTENEIESRQGGKQEVPTERKREKKHYFALAADMSRPLAQLRVPYTSDDRDLQRDEEDGLQSQRQATESFAHQESLSEYNPDAACGSGSTFDRSGDSSLLLETRSEVEQWSFSSQREPTETRSFPYQESLSEYNPDATCGSGYKYETCRSSSTYSDGEMRTAHRGEATGSFPYQESLSEYNPDATCGSAYEDESCGLSRSQLETRIEKGVGKQSPGIDEPPSKILSERQTDVCEKEEGSKKIDNYYYDGEPFMKRTKPNPEVTDEQLLLPHREQCDEETRSVGDSEFTTRQVSISKMSSVEYEHCKAMTTTGRLEPGLRQTGQVHSGARDTECLSSEFEHMNLDENNSLETGAAFQTSQGLNSRESTLESSKDLLDGSSYSAGAHTLPHAQTSTANILSQGARPKTSERLPRGKKHKTPKQNTKNAYAELAKDVAGDLSAINRQMDDSRSGNRKGGDQRNHTRDQVLFDGGSVQVARTNTSSPYASRAEHDEVDAQQQPSLARDERIRNGVDRDQNEDTSMLRDAAQTADKNTYATSRRTRDTPEARAAADKQQQMIDNSGPELQALVIEMMQRDEEELGGGHVLHNVHFNPPVPHREQFREQRESNNQGAGVQGASQQSLGKKSGKGKKKKGHYVEIAGVIASDLANMNKALMNGHGDGEERSSQRGRTVIDHSDGASVGAVGYSSHHHDTGARPRVQRSSNQGAWEVSSRDQSNAHTSLPQPAKRGNGYRNLGKCP